MKKHHHSMAGVFVFLLLGLFAVMSMLLVLESAQAYRTVVDATTQHNNQRVLRAYIRNALAAEDAEGVVRVLDSDGLQVLAIAQPAAEGETETYVRYIYCYDGAMRDLFMDSSYPFEPENGEVICALEQCNIEQQGQLLYVTMTDADGQVYEETIALRAAWEVSAP